MNNSKTIAKIVGSDSANYSLSSVVSGDVVTCKVSIFIPSGFDSANYNMVDYLSENCLEQLRQQSGSNEKQGN